MKNKRRSRLWSIDSNEFKNIVLNSKSLSEIARRFNYSVNSSIFDMIKERIEFEGIDMSLLDKARERDKEERLATLCRNNRIPLSEILVENSTYTHNKNLKSRLIAEGLLEEKCAKCGLGNSWNGEPLNLQLDHANGINNDNRLINLRLLCPNCHSQTPTFCGKHLATVNKCKFCGLRISKKATHCIDCSNKLINKSISQRKVERPSKEELLQLILTKPFLQIGNDYGVSDNAIRKWCKYYDLPYRKKDIEEYIKEHSLIHS